MAADSFPTAEPRGFSLFELARVTGGSISQAHDNWCPSLSDGGSCTCEGGPTYRVVPATKRGRGR
jgi:hypothetical protein